MLKRKFENSILKITVEELELNRRTGYSAFITTCWTKDGCLEADRTVYEFETFGGAMDMAFDLLSVYTKSVIQ